MDGREEAGACVGLVGSSLPTAAWYTCKSQLYNSYSIFFAWLVLLPRRDVDFIR